nr:MAG TPA: hypothetical protein [Caudoviricetes sp.]
MSYPVQPRSLLILVGLNSEDSVLIGIVEEGYLEVRVAAHASDVDDGVGSGHPADNVVKPLSVLHGDSTVVRKDVVLHVVSELDMFLMTLSHILFTSNLVGLEVLSIEGSLLNYLLVGILHRSRRVIHNSFRYQMLRIGFATLRISSCSHLRFVLSFSNFSQLLVDLDGCFLEVSLELARECDIYAQAAGDSSGSEI